MSKTIRLATIDQEGEFGCYVAEPEAAPKAAIIVIQEIFGVNAGIRRKCDKWAEAGYLALAPDLFWRLEPDVELDPDIPSEFDRALGLMNRLDQDAAIADIEATIRAIRGGKAGLAATAKVGCVGYCLGGRLAFMTACRTDIDASVGYYGVGIDGLIGDARAIAHPVLLHIPTADHFVDKDAQAAMHAGLEDHAKVTLHDYPGLDHGFATEFGKRRDEAGATLADRRTAEFFAANLA
ncbi:MAG: dienelactone hydrolase family protein [Sphingomonadales bacterium]|nr:dienelactone hydrolase family protein [Sphingomonadales bacterium]